MALEALRCMTDWLAVMSADNWEICERERLIAFGDHRRSRLDRLAEGDRLWVYVNRQHADRQLPKVERLRAIVRVVGPTVRLTTSPWFRRGAAEFHLARSISIVRRASVPAKETLKTLSFAGRPPAWGIRLLGAPVELTVADVTVLNSLLTKSDVRSSEV